MKKLILILFVFGALNIYAQQIPQYSQYIRNQYIVNPAAAGMYDFTDITLLGRSQWTGVSYAPMTSYLTFSTPAFNKWTRRARNHVYDPGLRSGSAVPASPEVGTGKLKHAIGGQLMADQFGAFRKMKANLTYAIHLPMTRDINFSFGANVGLANNTFLKERAAVDDQSLDMTYNRFISGGLNSNTLNIGAGFYMYSRRFFLGLSADQLTQDMVSFGNSSVNFDDQTYINSVAGIKLKLSDVFMVTPAVNVKMMKPAPLSIDMTIQVEYKKWLWAAISYRNTDAVVGMLGMNINKKLKFGYAYDQTVSRLAYFNSGSHELILGIMLR